MSNPPSSKEREQQVDEKASFDLLSLPPFPSSPVSLFTPTSFRFFSHRRPKLIRLSFLPALFSSNRSPSSLRNPNSNQLSHLFLLPPTLPPLRLSSLAPPTIHLTPTSPRHHPHQPGTPPPPSSLSSSPSSVVSRQRTKLSKLKAKVHASSIARLSSENDSLTKTIEDQDRVIAELSRAAIPDGHWVWETEKDELERSRGKDGRWLFSLEKYKPNPLRITAGPPTSLLSLPVELLQTIFELVEPDEFDHLPFFYVSFRLAEVLSSILYGKVVLVNAEETLLYFEAKTSPDTPTTPRVSALFAAQTLAIELGNNAWSHDQLRALQLLVQARGAPLNVDRLRLCFSHATDLFADSNVLATVAKSCFNPIELQLYSIFTPATEMYRPPSSSVVPLSSTSFLSAWSRLKKAICSGQGSIILLEGDGKKETVFSRHWGAEGQGTVRTRVETTRRAHLGAPEDSVRTVEVGVTPYEWLKQYVDGAEAMRFSIIEEVEEGGDDGNDLVQ